MKKGIVIFDLTDTLVNTTAVWIEAYKSLIKELNIEINRIESDILRSGGPEKALEALMDFHRVPYTHTELAIKLGSYAIADFDNDAILMPGAVEGVMAMHDQGYSVATIANTNPALTEMARKKFGKLLQIDKWYNTRNLRLSKDNNRLYEIIAEDFSMDKSKCVLIDNSEPVIKAVSKMGIKTIFLSDYPIKEADRTIKSLHDLCLSKESKRPTSSFIFTESLLF